MDAQYLEAQIAGLRKIQQEALAKFHQTTGAIASYQALLAKLASDEEAQEAQEDPDASED